MSAANFNPECTDKSSGRATLSVVIVAKNEEATIAQVLAAVQPIASEVILVDSGSTDCTLEIARSFNARIVEQEWLGYAAQKNLALGLAGCDWILSLDADEILTPPLVLEIEQVLLSQSLRERFQGFKIPRVLYLGTTAVWHGGFYPDAQLRLIKRGAGKFNDRLVHERIFVDGTVGQLKNYFEHRSYAGVGEFQNAMESYARLSAQEALKSGFGPWKVSMVNELLHPCWTFFMRYVIKGGFLDGYLGFQLNWIYADYVKRKIRYLRQAARG